MMQCNIFYTVQIKSKVKMNDENSNNNKSGDGCKFAAVMLRTAETRVETVLTGSTGTRPLLNK